MKRIICSLFALCSMFMEGSSMFAQTGVYLTPIKNEPLGNGAPRSPIRVPSASIDDHTFYINESHPDYVLQLVDPEDEQNVVYEVLMPTGTNSVVLPSSLVGEYVIQLIWGNWRFWGYIELESVLIY